MAARRCIQALFLVALFAWCLVEVALSRTQGATTSFVVSRTPPRIVQARAHVRKRGVAYALDTPVERYTSQDWAANLKSLPASRVLRRITSHLMVNTAWSAIVAGFYVHYAPPEWDVSPLPHSLMASALGLLLVFRTNAAYDRWWEGRKIWGSVTNTLRNIARTGHTALERRHHSRFARLLIAYSIMMRQHLARRMDFSELEGLLGSWEVEEVSSDPNPPALLVTKLGDMIYRELDHDSVQSLYLQQLVGNLCDYLGMCERILMTPIPPSYSRHTSRFLSVYCLTLPLVLVQQLLLFTPPVVAAICWGLFSIEEIGACIEMPFSSPDGAGQLPLERYTKTQRRDIERMLRVDLGQAPPPPLDDAPPDHHLDDHLTCDGHPSPASMMAVETTTTTAATTDLRADSVGMTQQQRPQQQQHRVPL